MARGPIGYTCPYIDRQQRVIKAQIHNATDATTNHADNIEWLLNTLLACIDDLDATHKFLEEIRDSNEELRTWGSQMEDENSNINDLNNELQGELDQCRQDVEILNIKLHNITI